MLRFFVRFLALASVVTLLAGPALAAPLATPVTPVVRSSDAPAHHAPTGLELLYLAPIAFGITIRKSAQDISAKFVNRAQAAGKDYTDGVQGAGQEWETNARAAEGAYEQGVQEAIGRKAFGAGIGNAGAAKYQNNAVKLGGQRYAPGVANAQESYVRGVSKYFDVLRNLQLPPKGPRRSPQNQARSNAVAMALGNAKVGK
jgi:hypothetical protein